MKIYPNSYHQKDSVNNLQQAHIKFNFMNIISAILDQRKFN